MAGKSVTKNGAIPTECTVAALGRQQKSSICIAERLLLREKRTLDNYFLCVNELLKTAISGHPQGKKNPAHGRVFRLHSCVYLMS
jgi:hypothetical protein